MNSQYRTNLAEGYPPDRHMLRDLNLALEVHRDGTAVIRAPVVPQTCSAHGGMLPGIVATLVDILAGTITVMAVYPDWMATAGLSLYATGHATAGRVAAAGSLLRAGSNSVIVQADLVEESGADFSCRRPLGSALVTCSRLSRRSGSPSVEVRELREERFLLGGEDKGFDRPYLEQVGVRVLDAARGTVEIRLADYVRNSFGALQGGMYTTLADVAGSLLASDVAGRPMITRDMQIHYLSRGKTGPFRTACRLMRNAGTSVLTQIEIRDAGADDRLLGVAMNTSVAH